MHYNCSMESCICELRLLPSSAHVCGNDFDELLLKKLLRRISDIFRNFDSPLTFTIANTQENKLFSTRTVISLFIVFFFNFFFHRCEFAHCSEINSIPLSTYKFQLAIGRLYCFRCDVFKFEKKTFFSLELLVFGGNN